MQYVAGVALLVILFLTVADITGRSALSSPVPGTVEVTSMLLVVVVFLAVAHSEDQSDHITIDLIYERVGRRARWLFDTFAELVTIAVLALMSYQLFQFGLRNLDSGAETPVLDWPVWPFVFVAAFGATLYTLATILRVVLRLTGRPVDVDQGHDEAGSVEI